MKSTTISDLKQFGQVTESVSLKQLTTLKMGGICDAVLYPKNELGLLACLSYCQKHNLEVKILGFGSNVLASDDDFHGVIIRLNQTLNQVYLINNTYYAQAGASLVLLAHHAMKQGLSNLEWAAGIPATVGGAIFMNAGAYQKSMQDVVEKVLVLRNGNIDWLTLEQCQFGYRSSIFKQYPDWVILGCTLNMQIGDKAEIRKIMKDRQLRRLKTQPLTYSSCGSVFRNPPEIPAWQYIDACGLRGHQIGNVRVCDMHANFLVNLGQGKAQDMLELIRLCQDSVKQKFNLDLVLEVEQFNWNQK